MKQTAMKAETKKYFSRRTARGSGLANSGLIRRLTACGSAADAWMHAPHTSAVPGCQSDRSLSWRETLRPVEQGPEDDNYSETKHPGSRARARAEAE